MSNEQATGKLKVYFDGECPLCQREIAWLKGRTDSDAVTFEDITQLDPSTGFQEKSRETLMSEIHAQLPDGQWIRGMEVFRRLYRHAGLGFLLVPTRWPILKPLFDGLYTLFARNRLRLTGRRCAVDRCE